MSYNILKILLVTWMVKVVTCVFFHEPSAILLSSMEERIDFGFSMGFQKGNNVLVISAPKENNTMHSSHHAIGKVYTCPVSNLNENITCDQAKIDVEALAKYDIDKINPNQNFLLGASIATTQDYFLTCAPLWTSVIEYALSKNSKTKSDISFTFGTCFTYNGTAHRFSGYLEQLPTASKKLGITIDSLKGGVGFNTLADEENNLILIAKTFTPEDRAYIYCLNTKQPLAGVSKFVFKENGHKDILNFGFGMAAGKFFSNKTSYAVSFQDFFMTGKIFFLEKAGEDRRTKKIIMETIKSCNVKTRLKSCRDFILYYMEDMGSMFGYTMTAADVNGDGFSELIVGAPGQRDENKEYGAVHIYVGGSVESMDKIKKTIFGVVEGARFGMTIATSDIDGDNIPEIIISAPYEDSGKGAVYIISGHKVNKIFFVEPTRSHVQVLKLNPQKIQKSDFKLFGYSLQVIEDLDGNGCNELAIGSPGSTAVLLFRSLQAVKVIVNLSTNQQKISDTDDKFYVKVCIDMEFNSKSTYIQGRIFVNNIAYGKEVKLEEPSYFVDLAEIHKNKQRQHCKNVTVLLENNDVGVYRLDTQIEMSRLQESLKENDFSKTVAVFNSHSKTNQSIEIQRRCDEDNCKPNLSMSYEWSAHRSEYLIGSSENETFTVTVHNDGFNANGGCVHVYVVGAQIKRIRAGCRLTRDFYTCSLRNPLRRNTTEIIMLELDMITSMTNLIKSLELKVDLFEDCNNSTLTDNLKLSVDFILDTKVIHLNSENHLNLDITEKSLSDKAPKILNVDQVYLIQNTGKVKWLDLDIEIKFDKAEFDFSVTEIVGIRNCLNLTEINVHKLKCKVDLDPNSITKVILGIEIPRDSIGKIIRNVKKTKIESVMSLSLTKTTKNIEFRSESIITYKKDTLWGHNKNLWISIGVLVALLLLGGLCYILHRYGFFQGQNKKKLDRARATVRQRSIKKSTTSQDTQNLHEDGNSPNYNELVEDEAFEEPSTATGKRESYKLIEEKAQVHNKDKQ